MAARDFFVQVRRDAERLEVVQAQLAAGGDEWRPDSVRGGKGDPTASRAIYNVTELADRLDGLRELEAELAQTLAKAARIVQGVREGLGPKYADILEQRYLEGLPWKSVESGGRSISRQEGNARLKVAFDWMDSLGFASIVAGRFEL